jgi:hypothetical protein
MKYWRLCSVQHIIIIIIPNVIVEWRALLLRLREDPASRLGMDVEYPDRFSRPFSVTAGEGWDYFTVGLSTLIPSFLNLPLDAKCPPSHLKRRKNKLRVNIYNYNHGLYHWMYVCVCVYVCTYVCMHVYVCVRAGLCTCLVYQIIYV